MKQDLLDTLGTGLSLLHGVLETGGGAAYGIATSDEVTHGIAVLAKGVASGIVRGAKGVVALAFWVSPELKKTWCTGVVGGFRHFTGGFNRNGAASIQSTRKTFKPIGFLLMISSSVLIAFAPLIGVGMFFGTFLAFFRPVDKLSLDSFLVDFWFEGAFGIGTALVLNIFRAFGAARASWRWVLSQL